MITHPEISKFVLYFFSELEKRDVEYAVLRKVEKIPESIGNDIDILIRPEDTSKTLRIINECAQKNGFRVHVRGDTVGLYTVLYKIIDEEVVFVRLDFTNPVTNADTLLSFRKKKEGGIYFLPESLYKKKKKKKIKNKITYPFRFLFPPGKFVVILGPDGVGKSTTAGLVKDLLIAFHTPVEHLHLGFRPNVLPTRKAVVSLGKEKRSMQGEKSKVPGIIRFFYHAADYFVGYILRIRPLLVRGRMVLGERYYYNYLVDPRPKKDLGFPAWLPKLVYKFFIPKPDVIVLLSHPDPQKVFERRQEHSPEEVRRQINAYRKFKRDVKGFIEVSTDVPVEKVAEEITGYITRSVYRK